jgi:hypothetical protein
LFPHCSPNPREKGTESKTTSRAVCRLDGKLQPKSYERELKVNQIQQTLPTQLLHPHPYEEGTESDDRRGGRVLYSIAEPKSLWRGNWKMIPCILNHDRTAALNPHEEGMKVCPVKWSCFHYVLQPNNPTEEGNWKNQWEFYKGLYLLSLLANMRSPKVSYKRELTAQKFQETLGELLSCSPNPYEEGTESYFHQMIKHY